VPVLTSLGAAAPRYRAQVLVVDDDPQIRGLLRLYLEREGHRVQETGDGAGALDAIAAGQPDIVLLDVMLPEFDGLEVCRRVRDMSDVPIILLTARSGDSDKVIGLDLGADDYIVKPFSPRELMARVRAHLRRRRGPAPPAPILVADGIEVDPNAVVANVDGKPVDLTATEFRMLAALMSRPSRVFTRDELIDAVHPDHDPGIVDRTIDVHLGRLRGKLGEDGLHPRFIATVRGVGYRFALPVLQRDPPATP
jgi:DNA-binding response OmpR family regulator